MYDFIHAVFQFPDKGAPLLHLQKIIVGFIRCNQISPDNAAGIFPALGYIKFLIEQIARAKMKEKIGKIFLQILQPYDKFVLLSADLGNLFIAIA